MIKNFLNIFFAKSKKMARSDQIITFRNELVKNCEGLFSELTTFETMSMGTQVVSMPEQDIKKAPEDNTTSTLKSTSVNNTSITLLRTAIHGAMISEWDIFLNNVFGEAFLYMLESKNIPILVSILSLIKNLNFNFEETIPTTEFELYEKIGNGAKDNFSFENHGIKLKTLKKLFIFDDIGNSSELEQEMKKQVQIRNIFQHNRGEVRKDDLIKIGRENQYLKIISDEEQSIEYREGNKIVLSKQEIENCYKTIEAYSKNCQVLKTVNTSR